MTIISKVLAGYLVTTLLLACAIPITTDSNTLIQHNPHAPLANSISTDVSRIDSNAEPADRKAPNIYSDVEGAADANLSDSTGLTRRRLRRYIPIPAKAVPIIINTGPPRVPQILYATPLYFMKSLKARQAVARRHRIELWSSSGVKHLKAKVDSLEASGFPPWLVSECWREIEHELERIELFIDEEDRHSTRYRTIEQYEADIYRLREKLAKLSQKPRLRPPHHYVEGKESSNLCQEPEDSIRHIPSPNSSSNKELLDIPLHVVGSYVNELQAKARRRRIEQLAKDGLKLLVERVISLIASGFPAWLVDECYDEIFDTILLIDLFKREEEEYIDRKLKEDEEYRKAMEKNDSSRVYIDKLTQHEAYLLHVDHVLSDMCQEDRDGQLKILLPMIRDGGQWRTYIKRYVDQTKNLHFYNHRSNVDAEINAAYEMYRAMVSLGPRDHQNVELGRFRRFLCTQKQRINRAAEKFLADQPGLGPTSPETS